MKAALDLLSEYDETLKDGFWPTTKVAPSFEDEFMETGNVHKEYDSDKHFVGHARDCLAELFELIGICMRGPLWLLGHPTMVQNILYGLQGHCQIPILIWNNLAMY